MICSKVVYPDRPTAIKAIVGQANDFRPKHKQKRRTSTTYFCDGCNGWHIATEGKKHRRRKSYSKEVSTDPKEKNRIRIVNNDQRLVVRNFSSKPL